MRHHSKTKKFGRQRAQRNALLSALTVSLITHKKIVTTEAKAKSLRPVMEKLITKAREADSARVRLLQAKFGNNKKIVNKLVKEIAPKYKDRKGGYTRITKLGARSGRGDASPLAQIELV